MPDYITLEEHDSWWFDTRATGRDIYIRPIQP